MSDTTYVIRARGITEAMVGYAVFVVLKDGKPVVRLYKDGAWYKPEEVPGLEILTVEEAKE